MPSQTFLNLNPDKKKKLLDAAIQEFSSHILEEASINQIIKVANISRGSFYTYFKDKEDLYSYLLNHYKEKLLKAIIQSLKEENGDILEASQKVFLKVVQYCKQEGNLHFFRNMFINLRFTTEKKLAIQFSKKEEEETEKLILSLINRDLYSDKSDQFILQALKMTLMITNMSLACTFMNEKVDEEEKNKYMQSLDMLKYGIYKKEEYK